MLRLQTSIQQLTSLAINNKLRMSDLSLLSMNTMRAMAREGGYNSYSKMKADELRMLLSSPPVVLTVQAAASLTAESILTFTEYSKGKGRASNDSNNKVREQLLSELLTDSVSGFLADATHGPAWTKLRADWLSALTSLAESCAVGPFSSVSVKQAGGRGMNYDFAVSFMTAGGPVVIKVEFKYGGKCVDALPQFFNAGANKPFHPIAYAAYFYEHYLDRVMAVYELSLELKPKLADYLKFVYQNEYKKLPLFQALYDAEAAEVGPERPKYKAKAALVHESIRAHLAAVAETTDLAALTSEFQRSQTDKHYLLYSDGSFHYDAIRPEELVAASVIGVRGDSLLIQSGCATTQHAMLLRWKNHNGILFPAWQISMIRALVPPSSWTPTHETAGDA
jgi:hypothetical protein